MKQRNNPEEKLSTKSMDFSIVLAGCIHDVKNSLSILINRVAEVSTAIEDGENRLALEQLQYQGERINNHLIQLLVLYRIDQAQYFANISEIGIRDLIADTLDPYIPMFANKNIMVSVRCSDDLYWYIDSDLIRGVLVNIMNNLYIYAESRIEIAAWQENQTFILQIKDDGPGYPDEVFDVSMRGAQKRFSFKSSNTGLGLFFSEMAAEMHQNNGKKGYITMSNDGIDGGGCFSIVLP
ncbi:MAG: HAMP domain-containing histidine kinase [Nitrosomonas sp.]|nr:HAMP domain-containing histidine kinase [Nitrosomonas sp.]